MYPIELSPTLLNSVHSNTVLYIFIRFGKSATKLEITITPEFLVYNLYESLKMAIEDLSLGEVSGQCHRFDTHRQYWDTRWNDRMGTG